MKKINKIKSFIIEKLAPVLLVLVFFIFGSSVLATGVEKAQNSLNTAAGEGFGKDGKVENSGLITDIPTAIGQFIGAVLSFVGVIFLVLMIYGGLTWMTARGNEAQVTKAKDLIQTAVIGLIIVLLAYAITAFIASKITVSGAATP